MYEYTVPDKFAQSSYSNDCKRVVQGKGLVTSIIAILLNSHNKKHDRQILHVLLDSGSDGDLLFVHEETKTYIHFKERYAPQKWRTTNGVFTTINVGNMDARYGVSRLTPSK